MKSFYTLIFIFFSSLSISQLPSDYLNVNIQNAQKSTVNKILKALDRGKIHTALRFFSSSLGDITHDLNSIAISIRKISQLYTFSDLIVFSEGHNIHRCRWYDAKWTYYQLDLHFEEGKANSKVIKFSTKSAEILKKEKIKRMNSTDLPPPPPK